MPRHKFAKLFPGLKWLQGYNLLALKSDFFSGITIAAMLIPQSMGYALVAGLPAEFGLYACIAPPIMYALLGSSNKISIGPAALDSILILSGVSALATPGTDDYLALAIVLTLMVGVIQLTFGVIKLGFIANFLSYPVILGYTSAAAIIIVGSQIGTFLGVSAPQGNIFAQVTGFIRQSGNWHWINISAGLTALGFMIYFKRRFPSLPSGLFLIVAGMSLSGLLGAQSHGIDVIAAIPWQLPAPHMPGLSVAQAIALLPTALTVALMGYVGSMSICKAQEKPTDRFSVNPNQELVALGFANIAGAVFRAFPVSGSFSRSAAFVEAGARTQVSAVVSSMTIVMVILFLSPLISAFPLPKVILAVIITVAVASLFKHAQMQALFRQNRHEFLLMLATFLGTLLLGVQQGLLGGVALSIALVIYKTATPHMTELGCIPGGRLFRNITRFPDVEIRDDLLIFRFDAPIFFANKDYLVENLYRWMKRRQQGQLTFVIFDAEAVNSVDSSGILMLETLIGNLAQQGIKLYITNAIGPVRDALQNSSLSEYFCKSSMFPTISAAINYIDHGLSTDVSIALQTNTRD